MIKPRFASLFEIRIQEEGVLLVDGDQYILLKGQQVIALAPYLNGEYTVDEITQLLGNTIGPAELHFLLMGLEDKGYIIDAGDESRNAGSDRWKPFMVSEHHARSALRTRAVSVQAVSELDPTPLVGLLRSMGIQVGREGNLVALILSDFFTPELRWWNQQAIECGKTILPLCLSASTIWLGPLFIPHETTCLECLYHRLRVNLPAQAFLQQTSDQRGCAAETPVLPSVASTAYGILATEILRWVVKPENHPLENTLVSIDPAALHLERHPVIHRPRCHVCGKVDENESLSPIHLEPISALVLDSGLRAVPPEVTLAKYEHLVSPLTGIVRSVRRLPTEGTNLVHNYTVGHSVQLNGVSMGTLRHNTRDHSGGKGRTDVEAKVSGLCEALERYSAVYQGDEPVQLASYLDMGEQAIHPNMCMCFSERQYQERDEWNSAQEGYFQNVPVPFDETDRINWTPVWSLTHQNWRYLPSAFCFLGYHGLGDTYCKADSNGLAAGNSIEEAILQGFMELVERDAIALWWYNRTRQPAIDLATFGDSYIDELCGYYASIGREIWALDITSDLEIPCVVAISRQKEAETEDILMGFGAHFSERIAVMRALSEVNQSLPTMAETPKERERQLLPDFRDVIDWWQNATVINQPYLLPDKSQTNHFEKQSKGVSAYALDDVVHECINIASKKNLEILVLDMTRSDIGLPVAKVIVPGLRHFWKRLGPGRLYDVPVQLKRIPAPLHESQLNPIPMFL